MLFDSITYVEGADHLYDISASTLSAPSDADVISRFEAVRAYKIPASMAGTSVHVGSNPSGSDAVITLSKNGGDISSGTISINTSGVVTLGGMSETSFAIGDVLEITVTTANSVDELGITLKTLAA